MKGQEQGSQDAQAYLAHDAVAGTSGPRAAFYGFGKGEDAGSFVSIERPAVLARIGNKPRAAAKVISQRFSPRQCSELSAGKAPAFSEVLAFLGENQLDEMSPNDLF